MTTPNPSAPDTGSKCVYPSEDLMQAWRNEYAEMQPSHSAFNMRRDEWMARKACDWQREQDALKCDEAAAKHRKAPTANDYYSCDDARGEACEELADAIRAKSQEGEHG